MGQTVPTVLKVLFLQKHSYHSSSAYQRQNQLFKAFTVNINRIWTEFTEEVLLKLNLEDQGSAQNSEHPSTSLTSFCDFFSNSRPERGDVLTLYIPNLQSHKKLGRSMYLVDGLDSSARSNNELLTELNSLLSHKCHKETNCSFKAFPFRISKILFFCQTISYLGRGVNSLK